MLFLQSVCLLFYAIVLMRLLFLPLSS
jgi:hypothetical protein